MIPAGPSNENRVALAPLLVALVTGCALVFPGLATSPLGIDEHVSYWIAGAENPGTLWQRSLNYSATPPLSSVVQREFLTLGGKSEIVFRLPSVIGFLAAVVFTFLFARELLGPFAAGLAVQLLVWHPDVLDRMRQARPYGLSIGIAALLCWLTVKWRRMPASRSLMLGWIATSVGLIWTHFLNLPLVGLTALCLIWPREPAAKPRPRWMLPTAFGLVTIAIVPLVPSLLRLQEWSSALDYRASPPPLWKGIGPYWWLLLPVGFGLGWLLTRLRPKDTIQIPLRQNLPMLILLGFLPIAVFAIVPAATLSTLAEARYRLIYAPASSVLIAGVLIQNRKVLPALLASAIGIGGCWWIIGESPWRSIELTVPAATDWTILTKRLQQEGTEDEPIFVYSGLIESRLVPAMFDDPLLMDYISCRAGRFIVTTPHPRLALPWSWTQHVPLIEHYERTLQGSQGVWLIASIDTDLGRESVQHFTELARKHGLHGLERTTTRNAVLVRFTRSDSRREAR